MSRRNGRATLLDDYLCFPPFFVFFDGASLSALAAAFFSAAVAFGFVIVLLAAVAAAGLVTPGFLATLLPFFPSCISH